jgi:hypothetical protein
MEVDDVFGYDKLVAAEKATLEKRMNYFASLSNICCTFVA